MLGADPFVFELAKTEWRGELGTLHDGSRVTAVAITVTTSPARYRCEVERQTSSGIATDVFAWQAATVRS